MNYEILFIIGIAIFTFIFGYAFLKGLRHAFLVPEGCAGLLHQKDMFVENAGNTPLPGVPGFMPLKNGGTGSPEQKPEDGAS